MDIDSTAIYHERQKSDSCHYINGPRFSGETYLLSLNPICRALSPNWHMTATTTTKTSPRNSVFNMKHVAADQNNMYHFQVIQKKFTIIQSSHRETDSQQEEPDVKTLFNFV